MIRTLLISVAVISVYSDNMCSCTGKMRDCVFIHGAGVMESGEPTSSYPEYWGNIHNHAPCCKTKKFLHLDTVRNSWYNDENAKAICPTSEIRDSILIGHSMGNLIIAHALDSKICTIEPNTTDWVSLQAPFAGSKGPHKMLKHCKLVTQLMGPLRDIVKFCKGDGSPFEAYQSLVAQNGAFSTKELNERYSRAQEIGRKYVTAGLCGTSPHGLSSIYSGFIMALSEAGELEKPNDGMVSLQSCQLDKNYIDKVYQNPFYRAQVNHIDGAFKNGNGESLFYRIFDTDRAQPEKWFECLF